MATAFFRDGALDAVADRAPGSLAQSVPELLLGGVSFRSEIVTRIGGKQALAEDPSGNLVELFQPLRPEAHEQGAFRAP